MRFIPAAIFLLLAVPLLVPLAVLSHSAAAAEPQRLALVVGNGRYIQVEPIPAAVTAAKRMAAALKALDFDVIEVTEASNGRISAGLQIFADRVQPGAIAVIYYAGHVVRFDGRTFLLPATAKLTQAFDILREGIVLGAVRGVLDRAQPSFGMLVLDTSRDSGVSSAAAALTPVLGDIGEGGTAVAVVSAAAPGKPLAKTEPFVLTDALVEGLERPRVELGRVLGTLPTAVAAGSGGSQAPWISGGPAEPVWLRGAPAPPAPAVATGQEPSPAEASATAALVARPVDRRAAEVASTESPPTSPPAPDAPSDTTAGAATLLPEPVTAATAEAASVQPAAEEDLESLLSLRQRRTIQTRLRALGFYRLRIDGVFGDGTRDAVRAYQKDLGEAETGRLSAGQIARLLTGADQRTPDRHGAAN